MYMAEILLQSRWSVLLHKMKETKSFHKKCKELSYEDFFLKFFRPVFFEFVATLVHTFWGSMIAPRTRPDVYESINR